MYMNVLLYYRLVQQVDDCRIVLMGDSAGGNLVLSLMNLIAFCKLPTPHAVVSIYPPTDLNPHRFTPSMIHSLQDRLLFFSVMRTCFRAYVPESVDYKEDWLLSPARAPD